VLVGSWGTAAAVVADDSCRFGGGCGVLDDDDLSGAWASCSFNAGFGGVSNSGVGGEAQ
jgi:hypothetical protein